MEINGEVNIEIDQYQDVSFEIDTDELAETLCQDHNLVDDVVLREYVREHVTDMVQDETGSVRLDVSDNTDAISQLSIKLESVTEELDQYELQVKIDDLDGDIDELREKIRGFDELREQVKGLISPEPDSDYSYVRTHVMDNYVRINDLREVIDAQIDLRVAGILNDVMKGIEEKRQENQ